MAGQVFITGGSGFVGSAIIDELLARGYSVRALSHRKPARAGDSRVTTIDGSLFDPATLDRGMRDCSAVIHVVGIIMEKRGKGITFDRIHREGTKSVVDAAKRAGIRRYVHMSAMGARPSAVSNYHKTKFRAEEYVRSSGLDWTIFRPSLIHGPRGEFMQMEAKWARHKAPPFLFMPYFGAGLLGRKGAGLLQPVYVGDVAKAFVDALQLSRTIGETYLLGGPDQITWPQLHHTVSKAIIGHPRAAIAIPAWYAKLLTHIIPAPLLPFNRDQVAMSQEDNIGDLRKFHEDFGWTPQGFEDALSSYSAQL